jgi:hypothetical protein
VLNSRYKPKSNRHVETRIMTKSFASLIAACAFLFAGCCTTRHARLWEYRVANSISEVNQLAGQGWTVVSFNVPAGGGPYVYLLKHAKP